MPDYALMNQCIYDGKAKEVEQMTRDALAEDRAVKEVLQDGLIASMSVVGEDFKHNIFYVPEVLIAPRALPTEFTPRPSGSASPKATITWRNYSGLTQSNVPVRLPRSLQPCAPNSKPSFHERKKTPP